ncbi:MAG TPA: hypothetical protein VFQ26_01625, partial [Nitrospiraceae bacterium]|nr:hypothetical protein [Nitrospiraceae bacterium]
AKVLHLRNADSSTPDGAAWNFPAGHGGKLAIRMRLEPHFGGAQLSLTDRFFDPCDDQGEEQATYSLAVTARGDLSYTAQLRTDSWNEIELVWGPNGACRVYLNEQLVKTLSQRFPAENGVNYLRLRSQATSATEGGFQVESVSVMLDD